MPSAAKIDCVVSTISSKRSVPAASPRAYSNASHAAASAATCSGDVIFGSVTTKFGGSVPPVAVEQPRQEQIERAQAAALQLLVERLDADADAGRQRALRPGRCDHVRGRRARKAILFVVGPVAEAVLEVDAEILDRLPLQLVDDARIDASGEFGCDGERSARFALSARILRALESGRAELLGNVRREEMRPAVNGVNRLPRVCIAWIPQADRAIGARKHLR